MPRTYRARPRRPRGRVRLSDLGVSPAPKSQSLLRAPDGGSIFTIDPTHFVPDSRAGGWGNHLDSFLARNSQAFKALDLQTNISSVRDGVRLEVKTAHKAGAIPLISAVSGNVAGGVVVAPRFGWPGVGRILATTGWGSGPEFLNLPFVPGSGREVPPWVLAGPVLQRLAELIETLKPGYDERVEVLLRPRGRIIWPSYIRRNLSSGMWHHLPCSFSELSSDPRLREAIRWAIERVRLDLTKCGGDDATAMQMTLFADLLLRAIGQVSARRPLPNELQRYIDPLASPVFRQGLEAIGWVVDERGLGGGRSSDGISWALPLEKLWERYVEKVVRKEAVCNGSKVRVGRMGETTIPLPWSSRSHRAIGHLVPDIIVESRSGVEIVDAKYKPHFCDLDYVGWHHFTEDLKDSLRADVHQVLAYSAVFGSNQNVTATLVYPVSNSLYEELKIRSHDVVFADVPTLGYARQLRLRALPFAETN